MLVDFCFSTLSFVSVICWQSWAQCLLVSQNAHKVLGLEFSEF